MITYIRYGLAVLGVTAPLLLALPAKAASCPEASRPCDCVAVVFSDVGALDPTPYVLAPWSDVANLQERIASLPIAAVHIYYTQFGVQGGPTAERFDGSTKSALGLRYVAPTRDQPREQLIVSKFDPAAAQQQDQGSLAHYIAALDDTEDVQVGGPPNINDTTAFTVLMGSEVTGGRGITDARVGETANDLGSRSGEIWTDLVANGCP